LAAHLYQNFFKQDIDKWFILLIAAKISFFPQNSSKSKDQKSLVAHLEGSHGTLVEKR